MDLTPKVAAQPGAAPIEGMPDAWHWSRLVFNFDAVLTPDREHLLEMRVMGDYDPDLARAVLAFGREASARIVDGGRPLVPLNGFSCPGWEFDTVAAVGPGVHENHAADDADLHAATWTLFPAFRCEFSGTETEAEAIHLFRLALRPTTLDRSPVPFLRMRYENSRTLGRSTGSERGIAELSVLLNELSLLDGAPGSWVEWENRLGDVFTARSGSAPALTLHAPGGERPLTAKELVDFAETSVLHPGEPD
jgi:hypothetical protein